MPSTAQAFVSRATSQAGFGYIEVLIASLVIAIAFLGLIAAVSGSLLNSSDPEKRYEALAVAQSYMDEIQAMSNIIDPSINPQTGPLTEAAIPLSTACANQAPAVGTARFQFNEICDYSGFSQNPRTRSGKLIRGLEYLTVSVDISYNDADARMTGFNGSNPIGGGNSATARNVARIDVTVSYDEPGSGPSSVFLRAYVTRPCDSAGELCPCNPNPPGVCP